MLGNTESPIGAEIVIDGRRYINFAGSSYLGLSGRSEIIEAGLAALRANGAGYQIPRQFGIATPAHQEVESEAAVYFKTESALYLASGYFVGLVVIMGIRDGFDVVFFDELAHYSLRDAIAASGLRQFAFRHLDADDLEKQVKRHLLPGGKPLVVTDGMFATLGEIAPLDRIAKVIGPYDGRMLVDESHSFGVLGARGCGAVEHHGIPAAAALVAGSLGKAFGCCGGIILGSQQDIAALRATPTVLGAGAGIPAAAAMCAASLRYARRHPDLLIRLRENAENMKNGLRKIGLNVGSSSIAPVASFRLGTYELMREVQARLMSEGIFVLHTNYIGAGDAGVIRCGIFADHTSEHINRLIESLRRIL